MMVDRRNRGEGRRRRGTVHSIVALLLVAAALFAAQGCTPTSRSDGTRFATDAGLGRGFARPEEAWAALVAAVRTGSQGEILAILGENARPFIVSVDGLDDARARRAFLDRADQRTVLGRPERGVVMAYLGEVGAPFPIPIARADGAWRFDTATGRDALVATRIRYNEMHAAAICRTYHAAQHEYASRSVRRGHREYARRLISSPGERDGLYWPSATPGDESPMAVLVAAAEAEGYQRGERGAPVPYHGYVYRVLTAQGSHAPGGARSYLDNARLTGGFALLGVPAQYGVTGKKTFLVNQDGVVYHRDLGPSTAAIANAMDAYDPDASWTPAP